MYICNYIVGKVGVKRKMMWVGTNVYIVMER